MTGAAHRDWTQPFLAALSEVPNVTAAARAAGITRRAAYKRREHDLEFAQAWRDALEASTDALIGKSYQRAMAGECSDTLVIFLLKTHRPEVYGDRTRMELSGSVRTIPPSLDEAVNRIYGMGDEELAQYNEIHGLSDEELLRRAQGVIEEGYSPNGRPETTEEPTP